MKPIAEPYFITYGDKEDYIMPYCLLLADNMMSFNTYNLYVFYRDNKEWHSETISVNEDFLQNKWNEYCEGITNKSNWISFALDNYIKNLMVNEYRDNDFYEDKEAKFTDKVPIETIRNFYVLINKAGFKKQFLDIVNEKVHLC